MDAVPRINGLNLKGPTVKNFEQESRKIFPDELFDKTFEYGLSDPKADNTAGTPGQGLFVAKTYMAKMGGTVTAKNEVDGVSFDLLFPPVA